MPVHPRACGERHGRASRTPDSMRFIPARAGNAPNSPMGCSTTDGSSPRVRGTLNLARSVQLKPVHPRACGERVMIRPLLAPRPVHPRACGERR